jgi:hypothetical protein
MTLHASARPAIEHNVIARPRSGRSNLSRRSPWVLQTLAMTAPAVALAMTIVSAPAFAQAQTPATGSAALASRLAERALQTRDIVYFLRQPETHAFDLYHDYTETREGADQYINVVRGGSRVSNPSAYIMDTGETLTTRFLKGDEVTRSGLDIGEPVRPETEVVVIPFPPVRKGESLRLRISETYTDSARYRVEGNELIWDRSFGRPTNAVVLPDGWYLTYSAVPATVSLTADGRVRLDFVNPRLDEIAVLIVARRRTPR